MFKHLCLILAVILITIPTTNTFACTSDCKLRAKFWYTVCKLKTPRRLVNYNWFHFEDKSDKITYGRDYWQEPFETFEKQTGDCDDYAIWNWYVLRHHGFDPKLILVRTENDTLHLLVKCTYKGKIKYVNQYSVWNKLPKEWTFKRLFNKPLPYKDEPFDVESDRGYIILNEGESIVIETKKEDLR